MNTCACNALRRADGGSHRSSGRRVVWRPSQVGSEAQGMLAGSGYARPGRACRCAGDHWGAQVPWLLHGASTCQSCAGCPSLGLWACCALAVGQHIQVHPILHHMVCIQSCFLHVLNNSDSDCYPCCCRCCCLGPCCFPPTDKSGYLIGSIEGRVAVHHVEEANQSKNFTFKCHRWGLRKNGCCSFFCVQPAMFAAAAGCRCV